MPRPRGRTKPHKDERKRGGKVCHSQHPGVTFERGPYRRKPWKVAITTGRKRKHVARFEFEADAAQAYRDALLIYPL